MNYFVLSKIFEWDKIFHYKEEDMDVPHEEELVAGEKPDIGSLTIPNHIEITPDEKRTRSPTIPSIYGMYLSRIFSLADPFRLWTDESYCSIALCEMHAT